MAADLDPLTLWYETAPPDSIAGRFRAQVRRHAAAQTVTPTATAAGLAGPDAPSGPAETSADPRLAGLEAWSALGAFVAAYARGRDPAATEAAGAMRTTLRSLWTGSPCGACGHTFRAGDVVRTEPGAGGAPGTVVHHDPDFLCAQGVPSAAAPSAPGTQSVSERFAAALTRFFPLAPGLKAVRLTPRHYQLAEPRLEKRRACMRCAHTLRVGEWIVRCPCGLPKQTCLNAVHHDPARGFTCYTDWVAYPKWRQRCGNPAAPGQETEAGRL